MMEVIYTVLFGLALAAVPSVMALCMCAWLCWKWLEHETRCLNKLMDDVLAGKNRERD
jgi:HAMP domain-containing protein